MTWFHHETGMHRNRKIRKIIRTHGATGYAFWCLLLEKIYGEEAEGFQVSADDLWFEDVADDLGLSDYRTPIRILDTFSEVGLIDRQLWEEHIIFCPSVLERGDKYTLKRAQEAEKKRRYRAKKESAVSTECPSPVHGGQEGDTEGQGDKTCKMSPQRSDPEFRSKEEEIKSSFHSTCAGDPSGECDLQPKEKTTPAAKSDPEFDRFWLWYKTELCPAAKNEGTSNRVAAHGSKGAAKKSWANLRKNNFFGHGLERFWVANGEYKKQAIASGGIGVPHAERYLRGKKEGSPPWRDVLEDMGATEAAEDPKTQIGRELTRLGANGVLPREWQQKTQQVFVADLSYQQAKEYAAYLAKQVAGEYQHAC